jgi:hypothetical protein
MTTYKAVIGVVRNEAQAAALVDDLRAAGFRTSDISVVFPDQQGPRDLGLEAHTKAPEGAAAGAGTGGVLGGTLGLLAGIGALAIPGLGPFIAAGPIMAALSGAAVGATVGGLAGTLIGLGIPELEAKQYEGKLRSGNILISVHSEDREEVLRAREILERGAAHDIVTTSEASVPRRGTHEADRAERESRTHARRD